MLVKRYDFDSIQSKLQEYAKQYWSDFYESSFGKILIDLIASGSEELGFYLERRIQELYLDTAKLPSSIYLLASYLNYNPKRKHSRIIKVSITNKHPNNIVIYLPAGTKFKDNNNIDYTTIEDIKIYPNQTKEIELYQGIYIRNEIELNGNIQRVVIPEDLTKEIVGFVPNYSNISENFLEVKIYNDSINEYIYGKKTDKPVISEQFKGSNEFYYNTKFFFNKMSIEFAYDIGLNPYDFGNLLIVDYLITIGEKANNTITSVSLNDFVFNEASLEPVNNEGIEVSYKENLKYGIEEEDIERIKYIAPKIYASGNRCVSKKDFYYRIMQFPFVQQVKIITERDVNPPNIDYRNKVKFSAIGSQEDINGYLIARELNEGEIDTIVEYMNSDDVSMAHIKVEYIEPNIIDVYLNVYLYLEDTFIFKEISDKIKQEIKKRFNPKTVGFNNSIAISDLYKAIGNIQSIDAIDIEAIVNGKTITSGLIEATGLTDILNIKSINTQIRGA